MLDDLRLYLTIVERGTMAAAAREHGVSPATVSTRLASLEAHFGAQLLHRTTRSLSMTGEGRVLAESARRVLAEFDELDARVRHGASTAVGLIRVSVPSDLGRQWAVPVIDEFIADHPEVTVDVHVHDGYVDIAGGGFDLALRLGTLPDSDLRVRKLASVRRVVVAAPSYLERVGAPEHPNDLASHECLLMRFGEDPQRHWPFDDGSGETHVLVRGRRTSNDGELVRRWCVDGLGVARKSHCDVARDLAEGRLVRLLEAFECAPISAQLVYPGPGEPPRRVRLLMDRLVAARHRVFDGR